MYIYAHVSIEYIQSDHFCCLVDLEEKRPAFLLYMIYIQTLINHEKVKKVKLEYSLRFK